jgi:hypothetical protein
VKRALAVAIVLGLVAATAGLLVVELRNGARTYAERTYADPCAEQPDPYPGESGFDATLQRILLGTLNGAACELGVSREELVLSLEPTSGFADDVQWDDETLERALRAGARRAIDDANDRDTLPGWVASILEVLVEHAPLDWVLGRLDLPFVED